MRYFHKTKNQFHMPAINLERLWTLVSEQTFNHYKNRQEGKAPVIDCTRAVESLSLSPFSLSLFLSCLPITLSLAFFKNKNKQGYFKVLGTGKLPDVPVIVRAKYFSKRAEEKIKAVGGVCELSA